MSGPRWLAEARKHIGQREIAGRRHNPLILQWWTLIHAGFTDDETPWCAAFIGGVLESCGIRSTRSAAARSYEKWGTRLDRFVPGCVVTFARRGGGHVGFAVAEGRNYIDVLGGNQGDRVSIARFSKRSASLKWTGYFWPKGEPLPNAGDAVSGDHDIEAGGKVTLFGGDTDGEPQGLTARVKHFANAAVSTAATLFAGLLDWRVAAVVAAAGLLVFCIIWFTHLRKKLDGRTRR